MVSLIRQGTDMPKKELSFQDVTRGLSERLRAQANKPNIYGYKPHEKQLKFHTSPARGRLYIGGNRSGKTTGGVVEDIWWVTGKHPFLVTPPPPVQLRSVCVDFLYGIEQIVRPAVSRWLPLSEIKGGSWEKGYSKELRMLTLENGSTIEFMSYEQNVEKFAGTSRNAVHFDEEPPKDIFTECKARLIDVGGSFWITMTPLNGMTWIYDDLYLPGKSGLDPDIAVVEIDMTENPYLPEGEISSFLSGLTRDDREARVRGKFVQIGGMVFKIFDPDIHVIDPFIPPKDWEWYESLDHGFNNPTAHLWHAVSPDNLVVTFSEAYESERTVDYWATLVHARNAMFGRPPDYYVADPAIAQRQAVTGASIQTEYSDRGIGYSLGHNDVLSAVNRMTQYMHINAQTKRPNWLITRNCVNLIHELQRLSWKVWASRKMADRNNKYDTINKKDDHAFDSSRYFFTIMPDLAGMQLIDPTRPMLTIPEAVTPAIVDRGRLDPTFLKDESINTEWSTEGYDEYLGAIW